ncbi:hypothetical protein HW132_36290 [Brasilonema sp. CT11]|nr:hypothetical protein [Brasilonema sp. CT11]
MQSWYQELQKNVPDCIIFLAGNKSDLKDKYVPYYYKCIGLLLIFITWFL